MEPPPNKPKRGWTASLTALVLCGLLMGRQLARRMVVRSGMSNRVGAVTLEAGGSLPGGGAEGGQASCSEKPAAAIDEEVGRLVEEARATARRVLEEQRPVLELLAQRLIDQETIEADEIEGIVHPTSTPELAAMVAAR